MHLNEIWFIYIKERKRKKKNELFSLSRANTFNLEDISEKSIQRSLSLPSIRWPFIDSMDSYCIRIIMSNAYIISETFPF